MSGCANTNTGATTRSKTFTVETAGDSSNFKKTVVVTDTVIQLTRIADALDKLVTIITNDITSSPEANATFTDIGGSE